MKISIRNDIDSYKLKDSYKQLDRITQTNSSTHSGSVGDRE
jgi:hypothetical protein